MESLNIKDLPDEPCIEELEAKRLQGLQKKKAEKPKPVRQISTMQSRAAARALSQLPRPAVQPKPRVSLTARSRVIPSVLPKRKIPAPTNTSLMRHTAAVATSKTTLGYTKGRGVSSVLRSRTSKDNVKKPTSSSKAIVSPERYMELYGTPPFGTEMWLRCKMAGLFDPENEEQAIVDEVPPLVYEEDEESVNFQLTL